MTLLNKYRSKKHGGFDVIGSELADEQRFGRTDRANYGCHIFDLTCLTDKHSLQIC